MTNQDAEAIYRDLRIDDYFTNSLGNISTIVDIFINGNIECVSELNGIKRIIPKNDVISRIKNNIYTNIITGVVAENTKADIVWRNLKVNAVFQIISEDKHWKIISIHGSGTILTLVNKNNLTESVHNYGMDSFKTAYKEGDILLCSQEDSYNFNKDTFDNVWDKLKVGTEIYDKVTKSEYIITKILNNSLRVYKTNCIGSENIPIAKNNLQNKYERGVVLFNVSTNQIKTIKTTKDEKIRIIEAEQGITGGVKGSIPGGSGQITIAEGYIGNKIRCSKFGSKISSIKINKSSFSF
jgi:hypothetical protein